MIVAATLCYLAIVNVVAFVMFGRDKALAARGGWRTTEADLLFVAAIGGSAGAFWGRSYFRHKTRKEPFSTMLQGIAVLQAGLLIGFVVASAPIG